MNVLVLSVEMHQDALRPPRRHTRDRRLRRVDAVGEDEEIVEPSDLRRDLERWVHFRGLLGAAKESIARCWNKEMNIERREPLKLAPGSRWRFRTLSTAYLSFFVGAAMQEVTRDNGMSAETDPPAIPVIRVRPRTIRIDGECRM